MQRSQQSDIADTDMANTEESDQDLDGELTQGVKADHRRQAQIDHLIRTIKDSADKLAADQTSRGDLKILSRALRELRYAFKVFSPYRRHRKVTVFGSARTPTDDPAYIQAVAFGEAMADLLSQPILCREMGNNGQAAMRARYGWEHITQRIAARIEAVS